MLPGASNNIVLPGDCTGREEKCSANLLQREKASQEELLLSSWQLECGRYPGGVYGSNDDPFLVVSSWASCYNAQVGLNKTLKMS